MVTLTFSAGVLLAILGVACCTEYNATDIFIIVDVKKWEKQTSDYDWDNPVDVRFLNNITVGADVTVSTILAKPDESYEIGCYGYYYETKLDIDFPSTRKDSLTQHRYSDGDILDPTTYLRDTVFRFYTEEGKNGTVVCKSVEHPEHNVTLHILAEAVRDVQIVSSTAGPKATNNTKSKGRADLAETAHLLFSTKHGGVYCFGKHEDLPTTKSLSMILCSSPNECDLFQSCFQQNQRCETSVQIGIRCETADCAIIDEGYQTRMAQCKSGQETETAYFFTGFDKRRYKTSDDIPTTAMITMEDPILHTNEPVFIFCSVVRFLFIDDIEFSVMRTNGIQSSIPYDRAQPATIEDEESREARDVVQKGIYVNLTEDMTEIICMAPWYNSTEWLTTSKKLRLTARVISHTVEIGISVGAIISIVISISAVALIGIGVLWRKYQITKTKLRNLTKSEVDEFENGNPEALALIQKSTENGCEISPANIHLLPFKRDYIISPSDLVVDTTSLLGQGMYGLVMRGKLLGDSVAVKTTKPDADVTYFKALLSEVKVMAYMGVHDNVVHFLGAVIKQIQQRIVYVAIEFSPYGDLESFLKSHRKTFVNLYESQNGKESSVEIEGSFISRIKRVTTLDMFNWSKQIAAGMEYLAKKKVVHADLATQNVLLFNGYVAKITDFGLSRQLYEHANYVKSQQAPLPWRWMAIESLRDMEFSTASDVWSYGVTVWEIFSLAETPFPGHTWDFGFMEKLKEGLRMSKPKFSSADIYDKVMLNCWNPKPERRPSFEEIQNIFSKKIEELESGNYVCEVSSNVNRNDELVGVNNDEGDKVSSSVIYLNSETMGDEMKNESP